MSENKKTTRWSLLWERPTKKWLLGIPIGAFIALIIGAVGFFSTQRLLHYTSTDAFCMNCHADHSLKSERLASAHGSNSMGIVVECKQCHIPEEGAGYIVKKVAALGHVFGALTIDGFYEQEWLDNNRLEQAEKTRDYFRSIDSATCKNCHVNIYENQPKSMAHLAKKMHTRNIEKPHYLQQTCIDCHTGVSHLYPEEEARLLRIKQVSLK